MCVCIFVFSLYGRIWSPCHLLWVWRHCSVSVPSAPPYLSDEQWHVRNSVPYCCSACAVCSRHASDSVSNAPLLQLCRVLSLYGIHVISLSASLACTVCRQYSHGESYELYIVLLSLGSLLAYVCNMQQSYWLILQSTYLIGQVIGNPPHLHQFLTSVHREWRMPVESVLGRCLGCLLTVTTVTGRQSQPLSTQYAKEWSLMFLLDILLHSFRLWPLVVPDSALASISLISSLPCIILYTFIMSPLRRLSKYSYWPFDLYWALIPSSSHT
jgi:hypothetical protein